MQDRIFYSACFGFVLGILLRSFLGIDFYLALWAGVVSFALLFIFLILKHKWGLIFFIFLFFLSLGVLRFEWKDSGLKYVYTEGEYAGEGLIVDAPDVRDTNQKLVVDTGAAKILITTNFLQNFKYGDTISFKGEVKRPENFLTDQGKEFDYINYLKKDGILYTMGYPEMEVISHGGGNALKRGLFWLKRGLLGAINSAIYAPESLLMGGLILGERSPFSEEMRQQFIDTGTIHIVALSGYNVSIVADWVMKIFSFLPFAWGMGMGVFSILLFVLMTGGQATAVRAGLMAALVLFARATGRTYDVARALILVGVLMLVANPYLLAFDVSYELSFIATVAVIFFTPKVEPYFQWVTKNFGLREVVSITVAAYLFVLPFVLYKMGNLSLVALPANILVLPAIPFTMGLGFLTSFLGLVWQPLAVPSGLVAYALLNYELSVIDFFANFPFASFTLPSFPFWLTIAIYAWLIYKLFGKQLKQFFTSEVP